MIIFCLQINKYRNKLLVKWAEAENEIGKKLLSAKKQ